MRCEYIHIEGDTVEAAIAQLPLALQAVATTILAYVRQQVGVEGAMLVWVDPVGLQAVTLANPALDRQQYREVSTYLYGLAQQIAEQAPAPERVR